MAKSQPREIESYRLRVDTVQQVLRDHFQDNEITVEVSGKYYVFYLEPHQLFDKAIKDKILATRNRRSRR